MRKLSAALAFLLMLSEVLCLAAPALAFSGTDSSGAMIGGLDGLRVISSEQAAALPAPTGRVELTLDGAPLPYDAEANAYLIPQSAETEGFDGAVELCCEPGDAVYLCPSGAGGKAEALAGKVEYGVYAVRGEECLFSRVLFTPQSVLCLTADSGELPGDEREGGALAIYSVRDGNLVREEVRVEVNERGNTSRRFPKKSYRLHLRNALGGNQHLSIAGLRSDDDWILNPLYADTSKIRERLGYELWERFNSRGAFAASSRMAHVELFLNGTYWGLYGLQERVDLKQLDGSKQTGLLYKVVANDRPAAEELLACESTGQYRAFELQNGDTAVAGNLSAARRGLHCLPRRAGNGGGGVEYRQRGGLRPLGHVHPGARQPLQESISQLRLRGRGLRRLQNSVGSQPHLRRRLARRGRGEQLHRLQDRLAGHGRRL